MKLACQQLKQIIAEEIAKVLSEQTKLVLRVSAGCFAGRCRYMTKSVNPETTEVEAAEKFKDVAALQNYVNQVMSKHSVVQVKGKNVNPTMITQLCKKGC